MSEGTAWGGLTTVVGDTAGGLGGAASDAVEGVTGTAGNAAGGFLGGIFRPFFRMGLTGMAVIAAAIIVLKVVT